MEEAPPCPSVCRGLGSTRWQQSSAPKESLELRQLAAVTHSDHQMAARLPGKPLAGGELASNLNSGWPLVLWSWPYFISFGPFPIFLFSLSVFGLDLEVLKDYFQFCALCCAQRTIRYWDESYGRQSLLLTLSPSTFSPHL